MEPDALDAYWQRSEAILQDIAKPTQKQGRHIDWYVCSRRVPTASIDATVVEGTDHVGVRLTLDTVDADTQGRRIESPTTIEAPLLVEATEEKRASLDGQSGEPPANWDDWTWCAETGLLHWLGIQRTGAAWRGGEVRYKEQTLSRTQDGTYGIGTNKMYRGPAAVKRTTSGTNWGVTYHLTGSSAN